jgi:hypothetical protein
LRRYSDDWLAVQRSLEDLKQKTLGDCADVMWGIMLQETCPEAKPHVLAVNQLRTAAIKRDSEMQTMVKDTVSRG